MLYFSVSLHNFVPINRNLVMKKYFIRAIITMVSFAIFYILLDIIWGNVPTFRECAVQTLICGIAIGVGYFLEDKGWDSWKKIGDLFKRNKEE